MVRSAGVTSGELVLDLGAGLGAVTRPLAGTGARVIAVERDERIGTKLRRRIGHLDNVTVVIGDVLSVPLPRRPFRVVANLPFSITTQVLRRLVDSQMVAADLVVERGAGQRLAGEPTRPELARWQRRFTFSLGQPIPADRFRPIPPVDAIVLRMRRGRPEANGSRNRRSGRGPR